MDELRKNRKLVRQMGIAPHASGRGAITGREGSAVWDFLQLQGLKKGEAFTKLPHLTLAIEEDRLLVMVTIPHGIRSELRRNLVGLGYHGFDALCSKRSNLQVAVGASFPYRLCVANKNPRIVDHIAHTWLACRPLLDAMLR